jgi:hypothetical protein
MKVNVAREVAALSRMTVAELRDRFVAVFGEKTRTCNKTWLQRRIIWRLQAQAEGDLSERARKRAAELANDADIRLSPPKAQASNGSATVTASLPVKADDRLPPPGTIITRVYKGRRLQVAVLPAGFEFEGEVYKSLSAVAKAVTGAHYNGFLFFRLGGNGGTDE